MAVTTPTPGRAGADGRFARLTEALRAVRSGSRFAQSDVWMLYVGGALMPLGALLIVLGWLGAAHTPFAFEQTPYLISGGVLGLGLVVAGGFVYFGYWQTVRIRESRQQSDELMRAMARLETLLAGGAGAPATGTSVGGATGFVATPNGSIYHRPDCPVVTGRTDLAAVNPAKTKLDACRICRPLDDAQ